MSVDVKNEAEELVTATIDGIQIKVPKGTLVIRAAENIGIEIPRFCDHTLLDPVAACRQCIVDVPDAGNGRPMKPQPACALTVMPNMVVQTAQSNEKVAKHQSGMLEFLLINHPLDCPICDKGGECPLQNQAMSHGPGESRYEGKKRTYPKPVNISQMILIDRERCVLCQRCTRFSTQISGDEFISLAERGALSQITMYGDQPYQSYFSGNIIQICPVGALTSTDYRFQARPFDLVSTTTTCEHCSGGCELRVDHRHFQVKRRLAGNAPQINEEWNCDKGRFAFKYGHGPDRLRYPLVRRDGKLEPASWPEAIDVAVQGLQKAGSEVGVITGGRLTLENSYAYSRFARAVLGTNNIDFRSRPYGQSEASFLAAKVAGRDFEKALHFTDLEKVKKVFLVAFEAEEEASMVFLRLRKGWRKYGVQVTTIAPFLSNGARKMGANLIACKPGDEVDALVAIKDQIDQDSAIMFGERAGLIPGLLEALSELIDQKQPKWAWVPRRSGEIAAVNTGCLPQLLPGARPVSDAKARVDLQAAWQVAQLPTTPGLDTHQMLQGAIDGKIKALLVAGANLHDLADSSLSQAALESAQFVISLEQRLTEVASQADVVFPVALLEEQCGTFINWENRHRKVNQINTNATSAMSDVRVLAALADAMNTDLGFRTPAMAKNDFDQLGLWENTPCDFAKQYATSKAKEGLVLASWHLGLDEARYMDYAEDLKKTVPSALARISAKTAAEHNICDGQQVTIASKSGAVTIPVAITEGMVNDVIWAPTNTGAPVLSTLQLIPGDQVQISANNDQGGKN